LFGEDFSTTGPSMRRTADGQGQIEVAARRRAFSPRVRT
jgi:hypothetical protein